ncbi:hypothetical protein PTI98_002160 [Pleurotus ostreatus]|nr:hypothetical protein PTI98_002160 [Pleurotus ostreatus]
MALHRKLAGKDSRARQANIIASSIRVFRVIEGLAELPYLSPLKPICGLAIAVLDVVQTLTKLTDDHAELILRIQQLAQVLEPMKNDARATVSEVEDLEKTLEEVLVILKAEGRLSRVQRVLKMQELKNNILTCTAKLDSCIQRFTVRMVDVNKNTFLTDFAGHIVTSNIPAIDRRQRRDKGFQTNSVGAKSYSLV